MSGRNDGERGATASGKRHTALVEPLQRIGSSHDVETVLKGVQ